MQFTRVKAWSIKDHVVDIGVLATEAHSIDLVKKSILKGGYRAFSLTDRKAIEDSSWYKQYLLGEKVYFYIEGSGAYFLANVDVVDNEFYFEKVNLPIGYMPWIFNSWQSDFADSKTMMDGAISHVVSHVNSSRAPRTPLEMVKATRPEDGAADIVNAIREKIDRSLVCVFDVTNVVNVSPRKSFPNPNVSFELGYALQRKAIDQVFIVKKRRPDLPAGSDGAPFDYEHNRTINYDTAAQLKSALKEAIGDFLERKGFIAPSTVVR